MHQSADDHTVTGINNIFFFKSTKPKHHHPKAPSHLRLTFCNWKKYYLWQDILCHIAVVWLQESTEIPLLASVYALTVGINTRSVNSACWPLCQYLNAAGTRSSLCMHRKEMPTSTMQLPNLLPLSVSLPFYSLKHASANSRFSSLFLCVWIFWDYNIYTRSKSIKKRRKANKQLIAEALYLDLKDLKQS